MSNGCRGELAKESMARGATFLVVTTVRELKSQHQTSPKTVLSFCCRIREEWLREFFQSQYKEQTEFTWNSIRQAVEEKKQTVCAGIVINEKIEMNPEIEKASGVLADAIVDKKLPLAGWNSEVQEYLSRAQWLSPYFPDLELTILTDYDYRLIVHELCRNQFRYDKVKDKPVINFVKELFSYEQQRAIETLAPSYICSPSGRKWRIIYKADVAPLIRARIQELYDLRTTPRIANNMVAVVMEILAPNNRPVQITDDLEGFWRVHYPELKKTLSRRYPKHEWR
jgi:ATP-dependent helicase HrpB